MHPEHLRNIPPDKMNGFTVIDMIQIKNAVRLIIGGAVLDGMDIQEAPDLLQEMADEYRTLIKKELNERG